MLDDCHTCSYCKLVNKFTTIVSVVLITRYLRASNQSDADRQLSLHSTGQFAGCDVSFVFQVQHFYHVIHFVGNFRVRTTFQLRPVLRTSDKWTRTFDNWVYNKMNNISKDLVEKRTDGLKNSTGGILSMFYHSQNNIHEKTCGVRHIISVKSFSKWNHSLEPATGEGFPWKGVKKEGPGGLGGNSRVNPLSQKGIHHRKILDPPPLDMNETVGLSEV